MNADKTAFALVWTACAINMVADVTKRVKKFRASRTSK